MQRTEVITTCWAPDIKPWIVGQVRSIGGCSFIVHRGQAHTAGGGGGGSLPWTRGQAHTAGGCY